TRLARDEDAEAPLGPRHELLAAAARAAGLALIGGAIVRDPASGRRHGTSLVFDAAGRHLASYGKLHVPEEPGFWETSHYDPAEGAPQPIAGLPLVIGVQICSDINRPEGSHLLGALGAEAILAPRSTELATYPRWRPVFIANALTSCAYVLSVNRPDPEQDVLIGGPSIAVAPDGRVLVETTDRLALVTLERPVVQAARVAYPGYLPVRARLYADAWDAVARRDG
ncbi:MAG: carbon-nitrogen hydrolase family protein, partial [Candidatus Limnocylindrales bacterium]